MPDAFAVEDEYTNKVGQMILPNEANWQDDPYTAATKGVVEYVSRGLAAADGMNFAERQILWDVRNCLAACDPSINWGKRVD